LGAADLSTADPFSTRLSLEQASLTKRSTGVIMTGYIGIDVSSKRLDCAHIDQDSGQKSACRVKNAESGFEELVHWATKLCPNQEVIYGYEATGDYNKPLQVFLVSKGLKMHVFNPRNIRKLAEGLGIECKTDKVDSYVICTSLIMLKSKGTSVRSPFHERLRCISRRIVKLIKLGAQAKTRLKSPALSPETRDSVKRQIEFYMQEVKDLEKTWLTLLEQDPQLKQNYEMARSVEDVGHKTARVLTCEFEQDLSGRSTKQIASYSAVAPCDRSSGQKTDSYVSKKGNHYIKRAIYMPVARKFMRDTPEKRRYEALKKAGKSHDEAILPIMHTFLRQIAAVMKRGTPWSADPPILDKC
jgi:transposase